MIPVASRMLSVPAKPGTKRCRATSPPSGLAWKSWATKGPGKAGKEEVSRDFAAVGAGVEELDHEGGDDDADQRRDPGLQPPEAHLLQGEDREGAGAGDQPRREEGDAEEQVEAERGADHLGDVGGHRDDLGLDPEADRGAAPEALAAERGEGPARGDAPPCRPGR